MKSKITGTIFNFFRGAGKTALSDAFRVTAVASLYLAGEYTYGRLFSNKNDPSDIPAKTGQNNTDSSLGKEPKDRSPPHPMEPSIDNGWFLS